MVRLIGLILILSSCWLAGSSYVISLVTIIGLQSLPAIGLALLMGYTGQISLGHGAFYGLGAYLSALLCLYGHMTPWLGIPVASCVVAFIAWGLGWIVFRLRGHYLVMATLAFGIIVNIGFIELRGLTGGQNGLTGVPSLVFLWKGFATTELTMFIVVWVCCALAVVVSQHLILSPFGLSMRAVAENDRLATSVGSNVPALKRSVMLFSGLLAAFGGGLYAHYIGYLSPGPFDVGFSIRLLLIVAIGGFTNIWGVLFGAATITILGETLKPLGNYDVIAYGLLLVGVVIFCPKGLFAALVSPFSKSMRPHARNAG